MKVATNLAFFRLGTSTAQLRVNFWTISMNLQDEQ